MNILFGSAFNWAKQLRKIDHIVTVKYSRHFIYYIERNRQDKYGVIIPCHYHEMFVCNEINPPFADKIICCKDSDTIRLLDNKLLFIKWMVNNSYQDYIPRIYKYNDNGKNFFLESMAYPAIYKPNIQSGGRGIYMLHNESDNPLGCKNYTIQEYVDDPTEYVGNFYVKDGQIKFGLAFKGKISGYIKKGNITNYKVEPIKDPIFAEIFSKLNYSGFACANYKKVGNRLLILEINPRLGGSIVHDTKYLNEIISVVIKNM